MPELRQNIITREWVIIATERAGGRTSLSGRRRRLITFRHSNRGAFCPGNESMSAVETYRVADRDGWQVRVVENKFPALSRRGTGQADRRRVSLDVGGGVPRGRRRAQAARPVTGPYLRRGSVEGYLRVQGALQADQEGHAGRSDSSYSRTTASPPVRRSPTPIHRSPPPHRPDTGPSQARRGRSGSSTRPANACSVPRSGVSSLNRIRIVASTDSFRRLHSLRRAPRRSTSGYSPSATVPHSTKSRSTRSPTWRSRSARYSESSTTG